MFAYTGLVQRVVVSDWLVLVIAAPLLAALYSAWSAWTDDDERVDQAKIEASVRRVCLLGQLLGMAALGWQIYAIGLGGFATQHVLRLVRVGQLEASIDLALDATSASMALAVLAVGAVFFGTRDRVGARVAAAGSVAVAGALLTVMADGAVAAMIGATAASLAIVATSPRERPRVAPRLSDAALAGGIAVLFWLQGGAWGDERYVPDLGTPRVVAVTGAEPAEDGDDGPAVHIDAAGQITKRGETQAKRASPSGRATLRFDALPGATIFLDESRTPLADKSGAPLRAPIADVSIPAGRHALRIHAGGGLDDYVLGNVTFDDGAHVALVPLGPTLVYRHANDQLALASKHGGAAGDRLRGRGAAIVVAFLLLAISALLRATHGSADAAGAALAPAAILAPAIVLVRFAPVMALSSGAQGAIALLGATSAAVGAALATRAGAWRDLEQKLCIATAGAALAGAALGSRPAAIATLVTGMLGVAALAMTVGRRGGALGEKPTKDATSRTASALACAAISGAPAPVVAGTWAAAGDFAPAMSGTRPALAAACVALGVAYAGLVSFAVWRAHHLGCAKGASEAHKKTTRSDRPLLALGALALALGAAIAFSPRLLGAEDDGPFAALFGATPKGGMAVAAAAIVGFGAALGGWASARKRYGVERPASWAEREARAFAHPFFRIAAGVGAAPALVAELAARAFARLSSELDAHVFEFVPRAIAAVAGGIGWVGAEVERDLVLRFGARVVSARWTPSRRTIAAVVVAIAVVVIASFVMSARSAR